MADKRPAGCETCAFYVYDDEYGAYLCDMNMDEIARAVGYQGVSNFYRAFRERFGGTPCSAAAMMRGK